MVGTTLPAVVRVVDLPTGTTVTGLELFEAVQTTGGVGLSVQLSLSQMVTSIIGGLPTGGATGTILNKSSGSNFSTQFSAINTFVNVGTALATSGTATSIVVFVPNQGITRSNIATFAIGSGQIDTSGIIRANLTSFAIGSGQIDTSGVVRANLSSFLIGSSQIDTSGVIRANLTSFVIGSGQIDTSGVVSANLTASLVLVTPNIGTANGSSLSLTNFISAGGVAVPFGNFTIAWPNFGPPGTSGTTDANVAMRFNPGSVAYDIGAFGSGNIWHQARLSSNLATNFTIVFSPNGGGVAVGTAGLTGNAVFGVQGTSLFTGTFNVVGTTLFTSTFGVVGTTLFTSTFGVVGTSTFTGSLGIIGTTNITGTVVLQNSTGGLLVSSSTGVVSSQGGMVLLNTLSPNNVASTNDTTSFTSTYRTYMFVLDDVAPAANTASFQMQVATSGSNFISGSYLSEASVLNVQSAWSTTSFLLSGNTATSSVSSSTIYGICGQFKLHNPAGSVARKSIDGLVNYMIASAGVGTSTVAQTLVSGFFDGNSNPITGVNFSFVSGNIQTGTIKIYGIT